MRSGRLFFALAALLAVLGGVLTYGYLRDLDERVAVVVAARDLQPRETISARDVRLAYVHPSAVLPGALGSLSEADGRWVLHSVFAGEQVTAARTDLAFSQRCVYGLAGGSVAMFVPLSFSRGAGGAVCPRDRVDLVAVTSGGGDPLAYRLAVNLEVLELRDERGHRLPSSSDGGVLGGVLLAVPEGQVEPIALALSCGHVYLVLKGPTADAVAAAPEVPPR